MFLLLAILSNPKVQESDQLAHVLSQHGRRLGNSPHNALQNSGLNTPRDRNKMANRKRSLGSVYTIFIKHVLVLIKIETKSLMCSSKST